VKDPNTSNRRVPVSIVSKVAVRMSVEIEKQSTMSPALEAAGATSTEIGMEMV